MHAAKIALVLLLASLAIMLCAGTPVPEPVAAAAPEPHKRGFGRTAFVPVVAAPVYVQPQPIYTQPIYYHPQPVVYAAPAPVYHHHHHHPSVVVSSVSILGKK